MACLAICLVGRIYVLSACFQIGIVSRRSCEAVRPGYTFANADQAVEYGHGICDKIAQGTSYAAAVGDVKAEFNSEARQRTKPALKASCKPARWARRSRPLEWQRAYSRSRLP